MCVDVVTDYAERSVRVIDQAGHSAVAGFSLFIECWLQVVMLSVDQLVCNWSSKITHGFENSKFFLVIFLLRGLWVYGFMGSWVYGFTGLRVHGFTGSRVYGLTSLRVTG
jgi:hypothetical protein